MTDADPEPGVVERWTFTGATLTVESKRVHQWVDQTGRTYLFKPNGSPAIGGIYEVRVTRHDSGVTRHGTPTFTGDSIARDDPRRLEWTAAARLAEMAIQRAAVERKLRGDDALNEAIDPLVAIARRLGPSQRSAFAALIIRRIEGQAWR